MWVKWKPEERKDCFPIETEPVSMANIIGAFGLLLMAAFVSTILLMMECIIKHMHVISKSRTIVGQKTNC